MRLRYIGTRPFKILIRDETHILQEGDEVNVDPWKIRSKWLTMLFEVAETDPDMLTKAEKKFLKKLKPKKFGDPSLYTTKERTEEEWIEIVADKAKRAKKGEIV